MPLKATKKKYGVFVLMMILWEEEEMQRWFHA
jgi:hypothetical protein